MNANLLEADLAGADPREANLTDTQGLTQRQIDSAKKMAERFWRIA